MEEKVLVTLLVLVLAGATHAACPDACTCSQSEIRCPGAQLTTVPQVLSADVQLLDMRNNSLRDVAADELAAYSAAHVIVLSESVIERVDDNAFAANSALRKLQLGGNQLPALYENTFTGLDNLLTLNLTANVLRDVFSALKFKTLRELYLGYNRIEEIKENDLQGVPNLRILDLRNNVINKIHPSAFKHLRHLRFLILKNNPLRSAASNLDLSRNQWLHVLDLTNSKVEEELTNLPKRLRDVRLSSNNITNITSMFREARYIDMIILNDNHLMYIAPDALSALPYLRELWLNRNRLQTIPNLPKYLRAVHIDDNAINALDSGSFSVTPFVEIISLQNNKINRLPSESFRNLRLRMIDVSMNEIAVLQRYTFSNLPNLYSVDLSRNPIQRLDTRSFDNVTNLHWLQMARTKVELVEVENLEMLHMMKKLQYLDLTSSPGVANKLIHSNVQLDEVRTLNLMFNDLRTLPSRFPDQVPNIRLLYLSGNKWHCNASLSWLPDFILENENLFFAKSHIVCYTPLRWRGRAVHTLTIDELKAVTGPPVIDAEPCPDCPDEEPCDPVTDAPQAAVKDGDKDEEEAVKDGDKDEEEAGNNTNRGDVPPSEIGPEPADLQQADQPGTGKVRKFRGKILTTTAEPVTETEPPASPAESDGTVTVTRASAATSGGEGAKLASLSLVGPETDGKVVGQEEQLASRGEGGPVGGEDADLSNETADMTGAQEHGQSAVQTEPLTDQAAEEPETTTPDPELAKQRERDRAVWSMMQRMFRF